MVFRALSATPRPLCALLRPLPRQELAVSTRVDKSTTVSAKSVRERSERVSGVWCVNVGAYERAPTTMRDGDNR